MMGGAQIWPPTSTPGVRSGTTVRPRLRPGAMRVMGGPTQLPLLSSDCEFKSDQRSVSTSSSVLSMSERLGGSVWLMAPQGTWRPYEDQPAHLQR